MMLGNKLTWALTLGTLFLLFSSTAQADVTIRLTKACEMPWASTFTVGIQKESHPVSWVDIVCEETKTMQVSAGTYSVLEKLDTMPPAVFLDKITCKDSSTHAVMDATEMVMVDGQTCDCEIWNKQRVVPSMGGTAAAVLAALLGLGLLGYARVRRV